jgi:hypothetical protein
MTINNGSQCKFWACLEVNLVKKNHNHGGFKIDCVINVHWNFVLGEKHIHINYFTIVPIYDMKFFWCCYIMSCHDSYISFKIHISYKNVMLVAFWAFLKFKNAQAHWKILHMGLLLTCVMNIKVERIDKYWVNQKVCCCSSCCVWSSLHTQANSTKFWKTTCD